MNKHLMKSAALILIICALVGCEPALQTTTQPSQSGSGSIMISEEFLVPALASQVDEVSILRPHTALVRLENLEPGKSYDITWKLTDEDNLVLDSSKQQLMPTENSWSAWRKMFPVHKKHKAGRWTWTVTIEGVGKLTKSFTVLPPTPSDLAELARFEQAREEVFQAFSHYWLGYGREFFTSLSVKKSEREEKHDEEMGFRKGLLRNDCIIQIGGLEYTFTHSPISEADQLNGITYRGTAKFSISVYRYYSFGKGWSPWRDINNFEQDESAKIFNERFQFNPWERFGNNLNLNYEIQQKDGHWWITSDTGGAFANGKLVRDTPSALRRITQPYLSRIKEIYDVKGETRIADDTLGAHVKFDPEDVDRNRINTMAMLRGRPLR